MKPLCCRFCQQELSRTQFHRSTFRGTRQVHRCDGLRTFERQEWAQFKTDLLARLAQRNESAAST